MSLLPELSRLELEREVLDALRDLVHHSSFGRDAVFHTREIAESAYGGPIRPNGRAWRRVAQCLRSLERRGEVEQYTDLPALWGLP